MKSLLKWPFLIHLWTLSGLGFAMAGLIELFSGELDTAARLILFPLIIDFSDGFLARRFNTAKKIPLVSGQSLDMITDVIALTFAPMVFFWKSGLFVPVWGEALCILAIMTCSLKYAMKERILQQGYSIGSSPIFFSLFLFYLLDLNGLIPTIFGYAIVVLALAPIRYPITSLVTTHWRFGWKSLINYATFLAYPVILVCLKDTWPPILWTLLALVLLHLLVYPLMMRFSLVVSEGFDR